MAVFQGSRYVKTSIYQRDDRTVIFNIRNRAKFNKEDVIYYTMAKGDNLSILAYKYYNNSSLWWAILDANPKYQSEVEILPGDVIVIPSYEQVVEYLG